MNMKKILFASLLGVLTLGFFSCEDDNDSNPVVQQPSGFELNTPALAGNVYDLERTDSISFTYSQPDYGYTAAVSYYAQVSLTDTWENPADEEAAPVFVELDGFVNKAEYKAAANLVDRAIMQMGEYAEEDVPETLTIYVRMRAVLYSGYECFSNTIQLTVAPYYTELSEAEPEMWYLVGGCIADGSWDNTADGIGVNLVPMSLVAGYEYNASTGKGLLTYTGYFLANQGFKLVMTPGGWDNQWGNSGADGIDNPVKNDGASKNLLVPSDGYYTITLNTETDELTVEAVTDAPSVYHIQMQGDFNEWKDAAMEPVNKATPDNNHVWKYELDATGGDTTAKFKIGAADDGGDGWSVNWGAAEFPYGIGTQNGANIPVTAGKYLIIFNDITGYYHFYTIE